MEYKWTISALDCRINEDGLTNVITVIHWRYRGTDADGITAEIYGTQSVPAPNPKAFTPYEEITLEMVSGWLESEINMKEIQKNINTQIELIKNPINITLPLYSPPIEDNIK